MAKKFNIEKFNLLLADAGQKVFAESLDNFDIATQTKIRKLYETC